ncbi:MAG: sigma-70 family RNA polymerase sigma factor [Planctomycetales bacterium]|nr:sigma-70 family RNA polymerase sigma factor [Planctomycetales bacterium]
MQGDDGLEAEFLRLFSAASGNLYAFMRCLAPSASDTDDLFQELSLRLWTHFERFDQQRSFENWARGVARLLVLEHRRRRRSTGIQLSEAALDKVADAAADVLDSSEARRTALSSCLGRLVDRDRELLRLRYQLQLTLNDIAERCGRSTPTVHRSLARVHRMLLECIRQALAQG